MNFRICYYLLIKKKISKTYYIVVPPFVRARSSFSYVTAFNEKIDPIKGFKKMFIYIF